MPRLFCFGLGYSAHVFAARMKAEGWQVAGTCRTDEKAQRLAAEGFEMHVMGDAPLADPASALAGTTHLLASVPPNEAGDPVLAALGPALETIASGLSWVGYLSTTGVYGDHGGGWVDEETPVTPDTARGEKRALAERQWLDIGARTGAPVSIFRLAGIYGPGRNQLVSLAEGKAKRIDKPGQVFSRIHVADIAAVLAASAAAPRAGRIYNVCDDEAAPPQDVVAYAAELLGIAAPPLVAFEEAELSPMARSFYEDSKRVSNQRIKSELGVRLTYPTYREGLGALAALGEGGKRI